MDILLLDIEKWPLMVETWGLRNVTVWPSHVRDHGGLLCFSAKWLGEPKSKTVFHSLRDGRREMAGAAHELLDRADVVMTWYGKKHDIPSLNREFLNLGMAPPAPFEQIDLYYAVKRNFLFPSYGLQYVSTSLGFKGKLDYGGQATIRACMENDPKAWKRMESYNRQDVWLLEQVYGRVQPWVNAHPSHALAGELVCPKCGKDKLQRRGVSRTLQSEFQRYQCQGCGSWSRDVKRQSGAIVREVA